MNDEVGCHFCDSQWAMLLVFARLSCLFLLVWSRSVRMLAEGTQCQVWTSALRRFGHFWLCMLEGLNFVEREKPWDCVETEEPSQLWELRLQTSDPHKVSLSAVSYLSPSNWGTSCMSQEAVLDILASADIAWDRDKPPSVCCLKSWWQNCGQW